MKEKQNPLDASDLLIETRLYRHSDYKQQTRVNRTAHAMAIWHQSRVAP
jgi:hypothetical protein